MLLGAYRGQPAEHAFRLRVLKGLRGLRRYKGPHLVERDLQHDGQGQVAVEEGHTIGETEALSGPRRRSQQQPVDGGVRVPRGVQAHLPVGPGGDLHFAHRNRPQTVRLPDHSKRTWPCPVPPSSLGCKMHLTLGDLFPQPAFNTVRNSIQMQRETPSSAPSNHSQAGALARRILRVKP